MVEPRHIRVIVADNHQVVRAGLAVALQAQPDLDLVGEASDGAEALEVCARTQPDVVLMDLVMPGMDGVKAMQAIHQAYPQVQIIVLSSFGKEELGKAALWAGATIYLSKDVTGEELAAAIRHVSAGLLSGFEDTQSISA
ncbi:MAG TPA: response regulator transcription factor [Aggregatilineaceae bacterium]|nr:response regulator transcription factor [Aggregatilineaceae bacterium]